MSAGPAAAAYNRPMSGPIDNQRTRGAVLFDLDATLFDHRACSRAGLLALQAEFDCLSCWTLDELEAFYSQLLEEVHTQILAGELTPVEGRRLRMSRLLTASGALEGDPLDMTDCYQRAYLAARAPVPGAVSLLEALRPEVRIGIVTNNTLAEQQAKLDICGLSSLIDLLIASQDVGFAKPDPRIFTLALQRLGVQPSDAVMVGDSWHADVLGARAAGIRAIWFNPAEAPCPDPLAADILPSFTPLERALAILRPREAPRGLKPPAAS